MKVHNSRKLFHEGNELFDSGDFSGAIAKYRESEMLEPHGDALVNLGIAIDSWYRVILRDLDTKHPDNLPIQMHKVMLLVKDDPAEAVGICNHLLKSQEEVFGRNIRLRSLRLQASLSVGDGKYLVEDFQAVWESLKGAKGKIRLLHTLLAATHVALQADILRLSELVILPREVREILKHKANELKLLQAVSDIALN
ncbi:hypothetical protein HC928_11215 [bacterium]|nr:hypothetical protein [bacterium]